MCYYNGIKIPMQEFIKLKEFEKAISNHELLNRELVNGFDYGLYPVLKKIEGKYDFEISSMEWGFIPSYIQTIEKVNQFRFGYKKEDGKWQAPFTTLNAKGEELLLPNKIFRNAALYRRCLVISSGFFEWRHVFPINKKTGKPNKTPEKIPYYITLKEKKYFFMAGIWQPWQDHQTGEYRETFAIVTVPANELMAQIHNSKKRMPAILTEDLAYDWLLGDLDEKRINDIATFQISSSEMKSYTIAKDFKESLSPTTPFTYKDLKAIEHIS